MSPPDVDIDRPTHEVFVFLAEVENNPKWLSGMRSCTWMSEPPVRVGSTYDQVADLLGKEIVSSFVVTEHEPAGGSRCGPPRARSR